MRCAPFRDCRESSPRMPTASTIPTISSKSPIGSPPSRIASSWEPALSAAAFPCAAAFPGLQGVVTADADGQHHPDDIEQVADRLAAEPDRVVLGTRTFSGGEDLAEDVTKPQ